MRKKLFLTLISLSLFLGVSFSYAQENSKPKLVYFYSPSCPACMEMKDNFMPFIEEKYKDKVIFEYHNLKEQEGHKLMLSYQEKYGKAEFIPAIYIEGAVLSGAREGMKHMEAYLDFAIRTHKPDHIEELPFVDLLERFKSYSPLLIVSLGLTDGINPCAFTVIVFFVTFLAFQKYRKKEIIATGLSFIAAVFCAYFLLGLGIFNFLYKLRFFPYIAKAIELIVVVLCFILGGLAVYDALKFKATGRTQDMVLRLPDRIKYLIQSIIGRHFRQDKDAQSRRPKVFVLALSAAIVGFLVSALEAVCTGQMYLPTIGFVLRSTNLKAQAIGYLALYNLMFILPLFLVFLASLLGVSSLQFSNLMKKHLILVKILMASLFFVLGVLLIVK